MKMFRQIRIDAILNHKVSKYLLYAIGEILLVIIGILIAVSINNANEKRKLSTELQYIYKTIESDLVRDTVTLAFMLKENDFVDSLTHVYLFEERPKADTINATNISDCFQCSPLHAMYDQFSPNEGGYNTLIDFESKSDLRQDSLSFKILDFYSNKKRLIEDLSNRIASTALENLKSLEQYDWYSSFARGEFNKDRVQYFLTSKEYENKLTTFNLLNAGNLSKLLIDYKEGSVELINEIKQRGK